MGLVLFATFDESDIFSDPKRSGYVAMAQIPIVVALATKNNVLSWLSGEGYEKVLFNLVLTMGLTHGEFIAQLHPSLRRTFGDSGVKHPRLWLQ